MVEEIACDVMCPVNKALSFINKKWSIEIIRDMFFDKKRFKEFKEGNPNLSNKVLSDCLKNLESKGIIEKRVINSTPITTEYYLTERGRALNRVIYELAVFALESCDDGEFGEKKSGDQIKQQFRETLQINKA
ncbi:MAG TPA: helix-turn-helix domain-containing protein [Methanobacteriaceae archaeon]|nr:helix-turn-helix domain-containing protein [Methanobacteriaceae archaeon]